MNCKKFSERFLLTAVLFLSVNLSSCATGQPRGDGLTRPANNNNSVNQEGNGYSTLLVDINSYSTNGSYYQKKHEKLLLSMAAEIMDDEDLEIAKGSIGFYFDRKSDRRDRLFLGLDINTEREGSLDYGRFSVKLIKENVGEILDTVYRFKPILNENEVFGVVIGFRWMENGHLQQVNIWIKKDDMELFYAGKITRNEMYQRSAITNASGKIILLPI